MPATAKDSIVASEVADSWTFPSASTVVPSMSARTSFETSFDETEIPTANVGGPRVKTNAIVVLRGDRQPVAVIAASLTIMLR